MINTFPNESPITASVPVATETLGTHPAVLFLSSLFSEGDRVCITFIHSTKKTAAGMAVTDNFCLPLSKAITDTGIARMQARNADGWNVYVSLNALLPGANRRKKELFGSARTVFAEVDVDGKAVLAAVRAFAESGTIPKPSFVVCSSTDKFQFVWRITSDFTPETIESVNAALVEFLGADPACTDVLRVFRIPSFVNWKYETRPVVEIIETALERRYSLSEFRLPIGEARISIVKPAATEDELVSVVRYVEEAAAEANVTLSPLRKWGEGYLWTLSCLWLNEHSGNKDSGTALLLHRSGALSFSCRHTHCCGRTWQDFRSKLEEIVGHSLRFGDPKDSGIILSAPTVAIADSAEFTSPFEHTLTAAEYDAELDRDYPVIPLADQAGPSWDDALLYGPAGEVIKKAARYNEAHPAGMLLDFLVALGNMFGRGPYFNINSTRHYTNEFLARVGESSYSRKGGGRDAVDALLKLIDPAWFSNRVISGFGSAEAIIANVRDGADHKRFDKKSGGFSSIRVPGITDKRLCIREGELASIFVLASKPDSRCDVVMRDGWDGKALRNVVKGSTDGVNNSACCLEPHLSISGDTTRHELVRKMPEGADENGFANRFLYCYVYRVQLCPNGGPELDWAQELFQFYKIIQFAKNQKCVGLSASANKLWKRMYVEIENTKLSGLAGKITSRAAAHIRRLALIYAMIDLSDVIEVRHLHAARLLWNYCAESAQYIFNKYTRDQLQILHFIEKKTISNLTEIREQLFHRNKRAGWIKAQVEELVRSGYLSRSGETVKFVKK